MSEAVTVPSLMMTSIVSKELFARDTHTDKVCFITVVKHKQYKYNTNTVFNFT